jgi:hypothetical protein
VKIPIWQLALRFGLELGSLITVGLWARGLASGVLSVVAAIGAPLLLATLWGTFAVPDDPSRSGAAPVPVPGVLRLILELMVFGAGTAALAARVGWVGFAIFVVLLLIHHLGTTERINWLLRQESKKRP